MSEYVDSYVFEKEDNQVVNKGGEKNKIVSLHKYEYKLLWK